MRPVCPPLTCPPGLLALAGTATQMRSIHAFDSGQSAQEGIEF